MGEHTKLEEVGESFIIRAVACHDELVSALDEVTRALAQHEAGPRIDHARAVLAKAKGQPHDA